jgi:antitoxin component YwqK of YwqJK toxin-antitoxin module
MITKIEKKYFQNGKLWTETYRLKNEKLHRLDGPAFIEYYESGKVRQKEYLVENEYHRLDGPAYVEYYESGEISEKQYYIYGELHRLDGPAEILYNENGTIESETFIVNNICLIEFKYYCTSKENIFEYVQKYPEYIKEIELLARHNHWLSEKELELLVCIDMFI